MQVSIRRIPNYIAARSQKGLRRLMLLKNTKEGKEYNYFDIQFVNGKWVAWFYQKVDLLQPDNPITSNEE